MANTQIVMLIRSQYGQHRKHPIVTCIFDSVGMCLLSHCSEMVVIYLPISQPLHSNGCCLIVCFEAFAYHRAYMPQNMYIYIYIYILSLVLMTTDMGLAR
jgi:hypothetical protein